MNDIFSFQAMGMVGAVILIYFLMVALFRSYLTPLVVLSAVPVGVIGVILMLFFTGTALNVQSLLGVIFMVGIVVSNTVLLTDFAENLRKTERLTPTGGDPPGGGHPRSAGGDDRPGDLLRPDPDGAGSEPGQRGQCAARSGRPRRPDRRPGDDAVRGAVRLFADGAEQVREPDEPLPGEADYVPSHAKIHPTAADEAAGDVHPV